MDPRHRADVIERSHPSSRSILFAAFVAALGLSACDSTPEDQSGLPDSGSDGGVALHASTPTITRFQVKQVCVPGNQPQDGISVSVSFDVLDDLGTDAWRYHLVEYRNPDGGPGLIDVTSPSLPPGNYSYPTDLPGHPAVADTSPSFSFDLPFLVETDVLPPDGGQVFSSSRTAFIEPIDGGCP
jgi:hypothetical protein